MKASPLDVVLSKFPDAKTAGKNKFGNDEWKARCPAHDDQKASLSIGTGNDGRVLLHCHTKACTNAAIVAAIGLTEADLFAPKEQSANTEPFREIPGSMRFINYEYADAQGVVLFRAVRKQYEERGEISGKVRPQKDFYQQRKARPGEASKNGFVSKMDGVNRVLYALPDVEKAVAAGGIVYVVEGEKDADNLRTLNLTATTNIGGAGKWEAQYTESLRGAHVVVLPDNDDAGRKHGQTVAAAVQGVAASVRVVDLPGLPSKGDVSDWLDQPENDAAALREIAKGTPLWTKPALEETKSEHTLDAKDPESLKDPFHTTDLGNAERLVKRYGDYMRFCSDRGWFYWDTKRWKTDKTGDVMRRAKKTVRHIFACAGQLEKEAATLTDKIADLVEEERENAIREQRRLVTRAKELKAWALKSESAGELTAAIKLAQTEPGIPVLAEDLDTDRWLLCCDNGTLNLQTGQLQPHAQADLITKKAGCAYLPDAPAPRWETFLNQILPDPDVRVFFQRAVGYALTGDVSEQCLFFLYGSGSNGKSTALGALMDAMGDYALQAAPDLLVAKEKNGGPNNEIADLQGARFVATIEVEDGQRMAEGLVKQITGGDKIKARFMRQDYFEFKPSHKIFLAANHQPVIRGQDFAIWRRIKVLPFTVQIADEAKDKTLPDKLRNELPGILAWAVRGCLDWLKEGLGEPEAVKAATDAYRGEMDALRDFITDCCVLRPSLTVTTAALHKAYTAWCETNGDRPLGSKNFNARLKEQKNVHNDRVPPSWGRGWVGIALRSDREIPDNLKSSSDSFDSSDTSDIKNPINEKSENCLSRKGFIGKTVSEVSELSGQPKNTQEDTRLLQTLLALRASYHEQIEPHEAGQRLEVTGGRVVWVDCDMAKEYWAGPPSGKPVGDVWQWEKLPEPFSMPPNAIWPNAI